MRIRVVSDLHFEFQPDRGHALIRSMRLDEDPPDALVIAGDLAPHRMLCESLIRINDAVKRQTPASTPILYIPGNHEYYDAEFSDVYNMSLPAGVTNLGIETSRFYGGEVIGETLWFPRNEEERHQQYMTDFRVIKDFKNWVYAENARSCARLELLVARNSIVVTHHLPTRHSISKRWQGNPLNRYFVTDLTALILQKQPKLWIHGHTHDSKDYKLGVTRIVCNPYGYYPNELNPEWNPCFDVEI